MTNYYDQQHTKQKEARENILKKSIYQNNEQSIDEVFERVAGAFSTNTDHATRINKYLLSGWFLPATPILANAGSSKNMPISCFLNEAQDTFEDIIDTRVESEYLTSYGGGIGTNFSNIREIGRNITNKGKTAGIIPVIKTNATAIDAVMQGGARRGAMASYLNVSHPEIEEFLCLRTAGGDAKRKLMAQESAHHGIILSDEFMYAVRDNKDWYFTSPQTGAKINKSIKAREFWESILRTRIETGEPYIVFEDNVNKVTPASYKELGLKVTMSNLCSEILLTTGYDHLKKKRTAVCCLSSLNLYTYDEWKDNKLFVQDVLEFLDNVLQFFIDNASDKVACAKYSAMRERSVGLGVMGFHSYLQKNMIPIESENARLINERIFMKLNDLGTEANHVLGTLRGAHEDYKDVSEYCKSITPERFTHIFAIAPTATISYIAGVSSGIEPYYSVTYLHKKQTGSNLIMNQVFYDYLDTKNGINKEEVIQECIKCDGNLNQVNIKMGYIFSAEDLEVFKRWQDMNQGNLVQLVANRQEYICQGQSFNILVDPNIEKSELHRIHWQAWQFGVKTMYYCRSKSVGKYGNQDCDVCQ